MLELEICIEVRHSVMHVLLRSLERILMNEQMKQPFENQPQFAKYRKKKKQSCTLKQFYKQESITSCIGCQFLWKSFAKVDYDEHRRSEHNLQKESEGSCQSG